MDPTSIRAAVRRAASTRRRPGHSSIRVRSILVLSLVSVLLTPTEALAYLDPGTGSMVVQTLIAALAAIGYGVRLYWRRIVTWVRPGERPDPAASTHVPEDSEARRG